MIGLFPEPYPDELLFSICSRYHDRLGYRGKLSTSRDLLGSESHRIAVDLPNNLSRLCASLSPNYSYTIDRLLHQNTLYPLYSSFLPTDRAAALRNAMMDSQAGVAHARAGVLTSGLIVQHLRFCPACVDQDRETFGETYWHRIHNTPGAKVCTVHSVSLENSWLPSRERSSHQTYVAAEKIIDPHPPRRFDTNPLLIKLALDLEWLLRQRDLHCHPSLSRQRYRGLLIKQGFATNRTVQHAKLQKAFLKFYSAELLAVLKCGLDLRYNWLKRLLQTNRKHSSQAAIHHLLLLNFLGCPIESFFSLPTTKYNPFGNGPWPCLNPASDHARELTITACKITWTRDPLSNPVGTFACSCGFAYRRDGPDLNNQSRYQFTRVTSYGEAWFALLKSMKEGGFTSRKICERLGVTRSVITNQLKRLRRTKNPTVMWQWQRSLAMTANLDWRENFRLKWLQGIEEHPEAGRVQLRDLVGGRIYTNLIRYDREWFELNTPPPRQIGAPPPRKDWKLKDSDLCLEARATAALMIKNPGRPVRASATAIARALGVLEVIHKRSHLLPLTISAIAEVAESFEDYAIRRILYAADCYKNEQINARPHQLQTRAAVSNRMWKTPKIKEAVETIMPGFC